MYNMIIVDDELPTREGMQYILDWKALNINIVGTAASGIEGLELVRNNHVDLIISDIRMKAMDGLSMIERLNALGYDGEIIVISGYRLFEYAQKAMGIGVNHYLLKPIDREELKKTVAAAIGALEEKRTAILLQKSAALKEVTEALSENEEGIVFASGFPKQIFVRVQSTEKIIKRPEDKISLYKQLCDVLEKPYLSFAGYSQLDMLIDAGDQDKLYSLEGLYGVLVYAGISRPFSGDAGLGKAYREACIAVQNAMMKDEKNILVYNEKMNKRIDAYFENAARDMVSSVEIGDYEAALEQCQEVLSTAIAEKYLPEDVFKWAEYLLRRMEHVLPPDGQERIFLKSYTTGMTARKNYDVDFLRQQLRAFFNACITLQNGEEMDYNEKSVFKIIQYIDEHYMEDISLRQLAEEVYINISYLSRLFKSYTGCTYIDYITKLRINRAKQLLKDPGLAVYEIANMLNYQDPKYFSNLFKKFVGETPREYRLKMKQKNNPT